MTGREFFCDTTSHLHNHSTYVPGITSFLGLVWRLLWIIFRLLSYSSNRDVEGWICLNLTILNQTILIQMVSKYHLTKSSNGLHPLYSYKWFYWTIIHLPIWFLRTKIQTVVVHYFTYGFWIPFPSEWRQRWYIILHMVAQNLLPHNLDGGGTLFYIWLLKTISLIIKMVVVHHLLAQFVKPISLII